MSFYEQMRHADEELFGNWRWEPDRCSVTQVAPPHAQCPNRAEFVLFRYPDSAPESGINVCAQDLTPSLLRLTERAPVIVERL